MTEGLLKFTLTIIVHETSLVRFWDDKESEIPPNQFVVVFFGEERQATPARNATANGQFDVQMNFALEATIEDLGCQTIDFQVMHAYTFSNVLIGNTVVTLGKVYEQPQHYCPKTRLPIRNCSNPAKDHGTILISVGVFGAGDVVPDITTGAGLINQPEQNRRPSEAPGGGKDAPPDQQGAGQTQSGMFLQYYNLFVSVHRGQDIEPFVILGKATMEPYVKISHNGAVAKTRVAKSERSPEWNVQFLIPVVLPTLDNNVRIMLYNGEQTPFLYGIAPINLDSLLREARTPFWINFYWKAPAEGVAETASSMWSLASNFAKQQVFAENSALGYSTTPTSIRLKHTYAGRLLVSLHAQSVQIPSPLNEAPSSSASEPAIKMHGLWVDVYEVSSSLGDVGPVQLEFCVGPHSVFAHPMTWVKQSYTWPDSAAGRVKEMNIYIPSFTMCWSGFIYVLARGGITDKSFRRVAYCQFSLQSIAGTQNVPKWYPTYAMDTESETFCVLASLLLPEIKENEYLDRPPRLEYSLKDYIFRAFMYEAINVPCHKANEFPSPYLRVELGGRSFQTRDVYKTLHPAYYQPFEGTVSLPDNLSLAPVINVEVWSKARGMFESDEHLGTSTFPLSQVPIVWDKYPTWLPIEPKNVNVPSVGHVLCAFELLDAELDTINTYPFFDDIRPTSYPGFTAFYLLGIRMYDPISQPRVNVCYGRDIEHSSTKLWSQFSGTPVEGSERCWNYMEHFEVSVDLPKHHIHNASFEAEIYDETVSLEKPCAVAFIPLTPVLPWLSQEEKRIANEMHQTKTSYMQLSKSSAIKDVKVETVTKQAAETNVTLQKDAISKVGLTRLDELDIFNYTESDEFQFIQSESVIVKRGTEPGRGDEFFLHPDMTDEASRKSAKAPSAVRKKDSILKQQSMAAIAATAKDPTTTEKRETAVKRVVIGEVYGFKTADLTFDLRHNDTGADLPDDQKKDEVLMELEAEGFGYDLPYKTAPLLRSTGPGLPEIVGLIKYKLLILKGDSVETPDQVSQYNAHSEVTAKISQLYFPKEIKMLVSRVYVLSVRGMTCPNGSSNPNVYVCVQNSNDESQLPGGLSHCIKDRNRAKRRGPHPELSRTFQLATSLPQNSIVTISFYDAGAITDQLIGVTHVDIENRWFDDQYQKMIQNNSVPIEQRPIFVPGESISRGIVRLWIDILPPSLAQMRPVAVLSNPESEPYQLRIVVWRVRNVPLGEESSISMCVTGSIRQDDDSVETQSTDIHFNSKNGSAAYRWRFVFEILLPAKFPRLDLKICQCGLFGVSDTITETSYDLSSEYAVARRKGRGALRHNIDRQWVPFFSTHEHGKISGEVELEMSIVTAKEASAQPVGKGRDAPNRNPYLDPVTENRTYIDWAAVSEGVNQLTSSIARTTKWGFYIGMAIIIIGGILVLIILLN